MANSGTPLTCAEFEILLCDAVDGTLAGEQQQRFEEHRASCAGCARFAADVESAVAFVDSAAEVEPPPELLTKLTFSAPAGQSDGRGVRGWLRGWLQPVLQPRFAMGMAMTILSFSMLGRFAGLDRQLTPADLHPARVWATIDDRAHRTWARAMKYYESLKLVYELQARLQEWTEQEEADRRSGDAAPPAARRPAQIQEGGERQRSTTPRTDAPARTGKDKP